MKKFIIVFTLLILVIGLSACGGNDRVISIDEEDNTPPVEDDTVDDGDQAELDDEDTPDDTDEPDDTSDVDSEEPDLDEEDDNTGATNPQTGNIRVETPASGETVTSPFEVTGEANVFEGTVLVRIRNQDGKIVVPELVVTARPEEVGEFGPFKIKINYQFHATKEGTVEVFSQDAKDGTEINMVEIPVKFD